MDRNGFRTVIFYCFNFSMGGTETLILRLIKFYGSAGHRVILLTETAIDESIATDANAIDFEHYLYDSQNSRFSHLNKALHFDYFEEPLVLTQFMPEFLKCFTLLNKSKYNVGFKHLLYILHPHSTFYGPKQIKYLAKKMIIFMLENESLAFMDETCIEECIRFYQLPKSLSYPIFRLPMFINRDVEPTSKNDVFNILSICRYEFPFKGYVLGLIKTFQLIHNNDKNVSLTIIGYGPSGYEINDLVQSLPLSVRKNIILLKKVQYNQIDKHIKECDIYVGMGTTVLDAANLCKIVITAVAYQRSDFAVGYFHENYNTIGEVYQPIHSYPIFKNLIEPVINSDQEQFREFCNLSKQALVQNYNISTIAVKIINHTQSPFPPVKSMFIVFLANVHFISSFLFKKFKL